MKEEDVKDYTYYFFADMIDVKNLNPNKIKMHEKSYKSILIYCIGYVIVKELSPAAINSVNP